MCLKMGLSVHCWVLLRWWVSVEVEDHNSPYFSFRLSGEIRAEASSRARAELVNTKELRIYMFVYLFITKIKFKK